MKAFFLGLVMLGANFLAVVEANAIPQHYSMQGTASGASFTNESFVLVLDFDTDFFADASSFFLSLNFTNPLFNRQARFDGSDASDLSFDYSITKSKNKLAINTQGNDGTLHLDLISQANGTFLSNLNFDLVDTQGALGGSGGVQQVVKLDVSAKPPVSLPIPSTAFLMIPALLMLFGRGFARKFNRA